MNEKADPAVQALHFVTNPKKRAATTDDSEALASAEKRTFKYDGKDLVYWVWGSGVPILLLHGWESRASHMAPFVPGLLKAGFSAVALDAPAHGESEGVSTNAVDYGRAVTSFANTFGKIGGAVAHSVGSAAALYAFARGIKVNGSVHISGPASMSRVIRRGGQAGGLNESSIDRLESLMEKNVGVPLSVLSVAELRQGFQHRSLIIHDPEDVEMPVSESEELSREWTGSALRLVHGVGHRRILRSPEVISTSIDFIKSVQKQTR